MSVKNLFPNLFPSLLLDFASTKRLDSRITFSRASTARFYDGRTVAKAEENLLLRSQEFDNAVWVKSSATITANTVVAPDGTNTAETLNEGTGTSVHRTEQGSISHVSGLAYTQSVFVKADTATVVQLLAQQTAFGANVFANFDLTNGVLGTVGSSATATITSVGNGWYRCTLTGTAIASTTQVGIFISLCNNSTTAARSLSYTGTSQQLFIWGAQLEQRSAVTAYTATTTQPITNYIPALQTAAAGQARFDHNPTTGESLGLLVEEQRTNSFERSEEFDNAYWTKTSASISADTVVAPDGTLTGDKYIVDSGTGLTSAVVQRILTPAAGAITFSVYAKAAGFNRIYLAPRDNSVSGNNAEVIVSLVDGSIVTAASAAGTFSGASATVTSVGNGWYRVALTYTTTNVSSRFRIFAADSTATTGDGFAGIFLWGAQLEAGAFATSYIPTTSASATRSADAASMTGANFSSWYRADEGTIYTDFVANPTARATADRVFSLESTTSNFIFASVIRTTTSTCFNVNTNGVNEVDIGTSTANGKYAAAYKVNDFAVSTNGAAVATDTSGLVPVVSTLAIGSSALFSPRFLNGTMKKLAFYPAKLTSAQLQAITS